jgi:hypothetical protein
MEKCEWICNPTTSNRECYIDIYSTWPQHLQHHILKTLNNYDFASLATYNTEGKIEKLIIQSSPLFTNKLKVTLYINLIWNNPVTINDISSISVWSCDDKFADSYVRLPTPESLSELTLDDVRF